MAQRAPFFWLHIKKSGGQSTRGLLAPEYRQVDRSKKPYTFIAADPSEHNDILNNYRIPLGDYQFRRAQFAKTFLYKEDWSNTCSFAFSRDPVRRSVSAFLNLTRMMEKDRHGRLQRALGRVIRTRNRQHRMFDRFCDMIEETRASGSIYRPYGLSFSTHTAAMFDDVTDNDGTILLRYVFRLEDLTDGINLVLSDCGIARQVAPMKARANVQKKAAHFVPSPEQVRRIEHLYGKDFDLHESACHRF
ncbi:sulfotransferase family 2 domain-containing protein [Thalassorhabdomicrobium marinisediminis]|uniref:sulfotransferase family 2 domain-containing protein n=1 Tax=Thalassorhabdomicrobium marinisediminis TaxID=2170577 RepID=UPI002490328E|nr:sulfotransferase family 2 domain-containing protein [Thalassorhabdomicrobium marinisediminis]